MGKDQSDNHEGWRANEDIFKSEKIESAVDRVINAVKEALISEKLLPGELEIKTIIPFCIKLPMTYVYLNNFEIPFAFESTFNLFTSQIDPLRFLS